MAEKAKKKPQPDRRSISCTELEWERLKEAAKAAGMPVTKYLLDRALNGNPQNTPIEPDPERRMLELVEKIAMTLGAVPSDDAEGSLTMREEINALFRLARERALARKDGKKLVDSIMAEVAADSGTGERR